MAGPLVPHRDSDGKGGTSAWCAFDFNPTTVQLGQGLHNTQAEAAPAAALTAFGTIEPLEHLPLQFAWNAGAGVTDREADELLLLAR